jgi:alkylhydroperoxidase/carboxymuconolactone decarboxylase family protein YurZ
MSLLNEATLKNATGEVKAIFDEVLEKRGTIPNGLRLWSVSPDALKMQWANIKKMFTKSPEEQKLLTIIRYLAANKNDSKYCIGLAGKMLIDNFGFTQKSLLSMLEAPSIAPLDKKHKALLIFAMKSISNADDINQNDIILLKEIGITEMEMFDIVRTASHMFVVNTLFKTFKVVADN